MKTFLRTNRVLEESIVPPAPDRRDEEEKERYVTRQLWWALIGLILFALAMFLGWGGAHAATAADRAPLAPAAGLAEALERAPAVPFGGEAAQGGLSADFKAFESRPCPAS